VNQPPVFTSPNAASVSENSSGAVYTATASDPNGNALTFSLTGGADRARFQISPSGALSFVSPPDFEQPSDADRNNVYTPPKFIQSAAAGGVEGAAVPLPFQGRIAECRYNLVS